MIGSDHGLPREQIARRTLTINGTAPRNIDEHGVASLRNRVILDHDLTVGRLAIPGQLILDHPNVSRRHARLFRERSAPLAGGLVWVNR